MKVLFAIGQNTDTTIQDKILSKYKQLYDEEFTYECEYYVEGVIKYLAENEIDILVLNELLENEPVDISIIDDLTDHYSNLKVILGIDDKHKEDDFTNQLYALGVYNCLFFSDFNVDNLIQLFHESRTKKQAKDYYEIEDSISVDIQFKVTPVTDDILQNTINTLYKSIEEENLSEIFEQIDKEFTEKEMCYLLTVLPVNIINKLKESDDSTYKKYSEIIQTEIVQLEQDKKIEKQVEIKYVDKPVIKEVEKIKTVEVVKEVQVEKEKPIIVEKEIFKVSQVRYESVILVMSNCSSGKSYLSWNLAHALSKNYKVAVVCIDEFSMLNSYFGTIDDYAALEDIDEKDVKVIVEKGVPITEKITLYTGDFGNKAKINRTMFNQLISAIHSENNIVIIDSSTGYSNDLLRAINIANDILVVYTMANGHIRLNNMLIERLSEELYNKNMTAVINNAYKESKEFSSAKSYLKKLNKFNNVVEISHCGDTTFNYMNTNTCNYLRDNNNFTNDIDILISTLKLQGKEQKKRTKKSIFNMFSRR